VLPAENQYLVDSCADSGRGLEAVVHVNVKTVEHAARWLANYELQSLVTLWVAKSWPDIGTKVLFKLRIVYTGAVVMCISALSSSF